MLGVVADSIKQIECALIPEGGLRPVRSVGCELGDFGGDASAGCGLEFRFGSPLFVVVEGLLKQTGLLTNISGDFESVPQAGTAGTKNLPGALDKLFGNAGIFPLADLLTTSVQILTKRGPKVCSRLHDNRMGRFWRGVEENRTGGNTISFFIEIFEPGAIRRGMMLVNESRRAERGVDLSELEVEGIELFINFLRLLGLPKSIGEIYGLLFVSAEALSMEDLMTRLNLSLGSASQGLRVLRSLGAVKVVYEPGDRRDYYTADLELSKFATVFLQEKVLPHLQRAAVRLERMEKLAGEMPEGKRKATRIRIEQLRHWVEKGNSLLPWVMKFLVTK